MNEMTAGIDIGSRSIELVVLNGGGLVHKMKTATAFDPLGQCEKLMRGVSAGRIVATGYGRKLFAEAFGGGGRGGGRGEGRGEGRGGSGGGGRVSTITEIQAYALGAKFLFPEARTVLDIGGQDTKVISLSEAGKVVKFEMNDRCAAGTGKFLEFMANALQVPLEDFGEFALRSDRRIQISSMCTVFAESEATSLMARGERPENIAMGLHLAIVGRTAAMLRRVGTSAPLIFAGGVAHNPCAVKLLEEELGQGVVVPENPDMVGALGAALYGQGAIQG
ncbi:MAG: acyl-CoA dehydratase activase [Syntrophobacteraceae bacterium]